MATKLTATAFLMLLLTFGESSDRGEPPSSQENAFDASSYAVHWDPDHASSGKDDLCYLIKYFLRPKILVEEMNKKKVLVKVRMRYTGIPITHLQKKTGLVKVLMRYIGIQIMHLQKKMDSVKVLMLCIGIQIVPLQKMDSLKVLMRYIGIQIMPLQKEVSLTKVLMRYIGIQIVPLQVKDKGFGESAYAVHWDPDHAPSKENGYGASAYAVHWDPDHSPSKENGFGASAYAVHWDPDHSRSKENGFGESAYAVHWDPDNAPSASAVPQAQAKRQKIKVQTGMLFLKKNLRVGTVLPQGTMFARAGSPKSVSSISTPLESKYLATILSHYKIRHGSIKAKQVADTLRSCGKPADKEEPHMCFSSREAMARFATKSLGVSGARAAITRIHGHETPNSMYVVAQIAQFSNNVVPCHPMDFPYEVFYCHRPKEVLSLTVQLKVLEDGTTGVTATAMCHMNTSDWNEQYFELLGGVRGEPICHYMPSNYIMFY
ncbi:BURP domain-containing protein 4-like [Hordeum vulgare]|nr:BURP domain-containing protein 4-like [Hordeum vulgare]